MKEGKGTAEEIIITIIVNDYNHLKPEAQKIVAEWAVANVDKSNYDFKTVEQFDKWAKKQGQLAEMLDDLAQLARLAKILN